MNSEIVDPGSNVLEQPEQTSSQDARPSIREPGPNSTGHEVPGDMAKTPGEASRTTLGDAVDAATTDYLQSAVEDGPGETSDMVEAKVQNTTIYCGLILVDL